MRVGDSSRRCDSGSDSILVVGGAILGVGDGTNDRFDLLRFDSISAEAILGEGYSLLGVAMRVGDASRRCE
jgi:hypothetical protein